MSTTLLIAAGAALVIIVVIGLLAGRRRKHTSRAASPYLEALHKLLEGREDDALEDLKRTVRLDSDNIMAYIQLGDIYRRKGNPLLGAKIHRNLLVRGDLNEKQTRLVLFHLVKDYREYGALDRAVEMAERLIEKDKKNREYQKLLLSAYEEKHDWDKAFFYRQSLNKWQKKGDQHLLALYKVQSGLALAENGSERESRIRYREALKIDRKCIPAYLYIGDSYRREDRDHDALHEWREFTEKIPAEAHLAFSRLREVLFDLGQFSEMEKIYQKVISKKPGNPHAALQLAEFYQKQGSMGKAVQQCRDVLASFPESMETKYLLVTLLNEQGSCEEALKKALEIITVQKAKAVKYICRTCGHETEELIWRCPSCGGWDTF